MALVPIRRGDQILGLIHVLIGERTWCPWHLVELLEKVDAIGTPEEETEEALKASENQYRLLVNQIPAVVFKGYADWRVDFLDRKVEELTGYNKEDFDSGQVKWRDLIPDDDFDYAQRVFIEALKTDKSYVREHRIRRKDGDDSLGPVSRANILRCRRES